MDDQKPRVPAPVGGQFSLRTDLSPAGDQPRAIRELLAAFAAGERRQTLLGVTGSGKTFTVAHVLSALGVPTLVLAHNKTLAAQLYGELRELFPDHAVEYFVSYYDYYQPEAYVPASDTYIDKDASINDAIDRMRHAATRSLFERNDVIIVASVSCIYGLGAAEAYHDMLLFLHTGEHVDRDHVIHKLVEIQYERNELAFERGSFRVRGDILEIFPAHESERAVRVGWFGDEIDSIQLIDPLRGEVLQGLEKIAVYPATHFVVTPASQQRALASIRQELEERVRELRAAGRLLEAQRLEQRTTFDLEMLEQMGYCQGIENYSRHLTGRKAGQPPPTLIDYFPPRFLLVIDESHQTVPQLGAMYRGDRSRKETLVEYGFRLPSALDNRPLRFEEFEERVDKVLFVSATPGDYELAATAGVVVEQVIRPTGLVDPQVEVRPARTQVDDLLEEIHRSVERGERVLVTTLTKRLAEDLTEFYTEAGVRVRYLHSDIDTLERIEILQDLRRGAFDVLIGINLLREGLDLPEVALVAILDADKEGFLRSARSLIQTIGRAARNINGRAILYADHPTGAMRQALDEAQRRREMQLRHNLEHGITPRSIEKAIREMAPMLQDQRPDLTTRPPSQVDIPQLRAQMEELRREMLAAATTLDFERATVLRDRLRAMERLHLDLG